MFVRVSIVVFLLFTAQPVLGVTMSPEAEAIRAQVEQIRAGTALTVAGQTISSAQVLPSLYERRDYAPVWDNPQAVRQLIEALAMGYGLWGHSKGTLNFECPLSLIDCEAFLKLTTYRTKNGHLETGGLFLGLQGIQ